MIHLMMKNLFDGAKERMKDKEEKFSLKYLGTLIKKKSRKERYETYKNRGSTT